MKGSMEANSSFAILYYTSVFRSMQTQWCSVDAWTKTEEVFGFFLSIVTGKES